MKDGIAENKAATVRQVLRNKTRDSHDRVDRSLGSLDLRVPDEYATFLAMQHAARVPIEAWCMAHAPPEYRPPLQTPLLKADLQSLGHKGWTHDDLSLVAPSVGWIGIAWAIAGSSMGNRMMLKRVEKSGRAYPVRFLADPAMAEYFERIRPLIDRPRFDEPAINAMLVAAEATFAIFAHVSASVDRPAEYAA